MTYLCHKIAPQIPVLCAPGLLLCALLHLTFLDFGRNSGFQENLKGYSLSESASKVNFKGAGNQSPLAQSQSLWLTLKGEESHPPLAQRPDPGLTQEGVGNHPPWACVIGYRTTDHTDL